MCSNETTDKVFGLTLWQNVLVHVDMLAACQLAMVVYSFLSVLSPFRYGCVGWLMQSPETLCHCV